MKGRKEFLKIVHYQETVILGRYLSRSDIDLMEKKQEVYQMALASIWDGRHVPGAI